MTFYPSPNGLREKSLSPLTVSSITEARPAQGNLEVPSQDSEEGFIPVDRVVPISAGG